MKRIDELANAAAVHIAETSGTVYVRVDSDEPSWVGIRRDGTTFRADGPYGFTHELTLPNPLPPVVYDRYNGPWIRNADDLYAYRGNGAGLPLSQVIDECGPLTKAVT